ncbi:MAG: phage head closure protein [Comamonas sp.]|nr:phage head closure protein [Comamonas sp.]
MTIIAGSFPHQIHIQRKTGGKDGWGTPLPEAWENITAKPIWANVKYLSGSESIKADASVSVVRASVRIRWRVGITAGMRVVHGADTLDIEAVLPGAGRQHVDLVCTRAL